MMSEKWNKKRDRDEKYTSFSYSVFFSAILGVATLSFYTRQQDILVLIAGFIMVLLCLAVPFGIDFVKSVALKEQDKNQDEIANWKRAMDRIENLEAVMCRLDTEINSQLEHTLSAGKFMTVASPPGNSQIPTLFLNLSSALQDRFQL